MRALRLGQLRLGRPLCPVGLLGPVFDVLTRARHILSLLIHAIFLSMSQTMITAVVGWHVFLEYLVHYTPAELVVPLGGLHDDRHHSHRGLHRQLVLSLDFIYGAPLPWSEFLEYLVHYIPAVVVYMVMISAIIRRPLSLWLVHSQ